MPDWQERITRETAPQIRVEHVVRYAAAAPLVAGGAAWWDLGCGTGVAPEEAFREAPPARALLVDIDEGAAREAARRFSGANALALDLSREESFDVLRERLTAAEPPCITCFEVIEHLERFAPLVRFLAERAEAGGTVVLSVPNDAFTGVRNPFHATSWGEGSLAELLTLVPERCRVLEQAALAGSALRARGESPSEVTLAARVPQVVATNLLLAFGPLAGDVALPARVEAVDFDEHRLWERQREADLAFATARVQALEHRLAEQSAPASAEPQ